MRESDLDQLEDRIFKQMERAMEELEIVDCVNAYVKNLETMSRVLLWMDKRNTGKVMKDELDSISIEDLAKQLE